MIDHIMRQKLSAWIFMEFRINQVNPEILRSSFDIQKTSEKESLFRLIEMSNEMSLI